MTPETFAQVVALFVDDSTAQLDTLANDIALLAHNPNDHDALERACRMVHTIKGSASMLALRADDEMLVERLETVSRLARSAEERFEHALSGKRPLTDAMISALRDIPALLLTMLTEGDAGAANEEKERAAALEKRIAETSASPRPGGPVTEPPSEDDLGALFDADVSAEPVEKKGASEGESLDEYRGGTPPPAALPVERSDSLDLAAELKEAAELIDEDASAPAHVGGKRAREKKPVSNEPPAPVQQPTDEAEGEAVINALAHILGLEESPAAQPDGELAELLALDDERGESERSATDETEPTASADTPKTARTRREERNDPLANLFRDESAAPPDETSPRSSAPEAKAETTPEDESGEEESLAALIDLEQEEKAARETEPTDTSAVAIGSDIHDDDRAQREEDDAERFLSFEEEAEDESEETVPPAGQSDPLREVFCEEVTDIVGQLTPLLAALDEDPTDRDALGSVRRLAHTIKGSAATLGYDSIRQVAQALEQACERAAEAGLTPTETHLKMFGRAALWFGEAAHRMSASAEPGDPPDGLVQDLDALAGAAAEESPSAEPPPAPPEDDPMRLIFLEGARQLLDDLNQDFIAFERSPDDPEMLHRILRAAHTLKGDAATVGYERTRTVAHAMEDVLQSARDDKAELNAEAIDTLLAATDRIDELTKDIARYGEERGEIDEIVARLAALRSALGAPTADEAMPEAGLGAVSGMADQAESGESDGLREAFIQEARELLNVLGRDLVALEQHPDDPDTVHRVLRAAHTLKGSASMLAYERIRTLAHAMEDALQVIRDAELAVSSEAVDLMLGAADVLERQVGNVARTGSESAEPDVRPFVDSLKTLTSGLSDKGDREAERAPVIVEEVSPATAELGETFLAEAHNRQTALTQALIALEIRPDDNEARARFVDEALALTGSASALGYHQIAEVSRRMEAIALAAKEKDVPLDPAALEALGEGMEALGALYAALREEGHDHTPEIAPVLTRLAEVRVAGDEVPVERVQPVARQTPHAPEPPEQDGAENRRLGRRIVEVDLDRLNRLMGLAAELVISRTRLSAELVRLSGIVADLGDQGRVLTDVERGLLDMRANGGGEQKADEGVLTGFAEGEFDRFSDIDVLIRDLRDSSVFINDLNNKFTGVASNFDHNITRISTIAKDLHDEILRVRMVRVERAFTRIPRIVRDAARSESKRVNLVLEGADTEIDKNILEAMNNPLLHLLRNTVGHGIEPPDEREARGKPAAGKVTVRAAQDGNQVIIEVSDDGRGIDPERIRRTGIERGLLSKDQADALSDAEIIDLIFEPGFSTVEKVSELSGRGVGLDVVRSVVNRFNGTVGVESTVGQGTTFRIVLPLTLAIGQALLVEVAGRRFALPLASVGQIEEIAGNQIVVIKEHPYLYRDDTPVPLIVLAETLGISGTPPLNGESHPVVIVREGDRQTAILVDRLIGREDIVIKTLGGHLRRVPGVSGATILGDGSVVMILNVPYFLSARRTAQRRTSAPPATSAVPSGSTASAPQRRRKPAPSKPAVRRPLEARPHAPSAAVRRPRILVADDSITIRKYVSGVLERGGYEVVTANDGADAWDKLQDQEYQLVISDLEMPRMHGYELIAEIKKNAKTRGTPVVFLTARASEKHRRMGIELGASAFLNKPFSEPDLLKLVEGFVT